VLRVDSCASLSPTYYLLLTAPCTGYLCFEACCDAPILSPPSPGLFDDHTEDAPKWCRARIEGRVRDEEAGVDLFKVLYVDYGNSETVPVSRYACHFVLSFCAIVGRVVVVRELLGCSFLCAVLFDVSFAKQSRST
jgi:hypothetical protein